MHRPSVFTAHDLLPAPHRDEARAVEEALGRFSRVIVHSEHGRETLTELGIEPDRLRVIPHPVFASDPPRADDGSTVLSLGVIRPYKGLGDTIEAVGRVPDARLLVVGDPLEPVDAYREAAGPSAEWRLGYASEAEIDQALAEATVAVFPYRPEIDQSGALLRALGAGVPVVAYDVGGIAEPVRRFEAGRVVEAGERRGPGGGDPRTALGAGGPAAGARGRPAGTGHAHLDGCGRGTHAAVRGAAVIFRRRFSDIVTRQLDLFEEEYWDLIAEADEAEAAYERADRDDSEELFGDYMDVVESGAEVLADLRDHYASTLEGEVAEEYRESFNHGVLKRLPRFALEIEDL